MGFFDKIRKGLTKTKESLIKNIESVVIGYATIDEDFLEDLEMVLLSGDIGVRTTDFLMRQIRRGVTEGTIHNTNEVMPFMEKTVEELLKDDEKDLKEVHHPEVILVVGVNGVGKTTILDALRYCLTTSKSFNALGNRKSKRTLLGSVPCSGIRTADNLGRTHRR